MKFDRLRPGPTQSRAFVRRETTCLAIFAIACVASATACDGQILDPNAPGSSRGVASWRDDEEPTPPGRSPRLERPSVDQCAERGDDLAPDNTPLRVLSRAEYNHTVRDLLGDTTAPLTIDPATEAKGFDNNAVSLSVDTRMAGHYLDVAEALAERAVVRGADLFGCDPEGESEQESCARSFIERFGARAFRRPVESADADALVELYRNTRSVGTWGDAMEVVITAILLSPQFLYHVELAGDGALDGYEMASRLSYFLWGTMPDDMLFSAAAANELSTDAQIRAQAERMVDDPRAHEQVAHFHTQWLGLDALGSLSRLPSYGSFDGAMQELLAQETLAFADSVVFGEVGTIEELFTANYSMLNERLARHYGLPPIEGDELRRVELDPTQRAGLLTQGSIQAIHAKYNRSSPVHRGKFVREQILCNNLPPPPLVVPAVEEIAPGATIRDRLAQHRSDSSCNSCHRLMDPLGFPFEHYDPLGRYRTEDEGGNAIDSSDDIVEAEGLAGHVESAIDLAANLPRSPDVQTCVTLQWFRFALGRFEGSADDCTLVELKQTVAEGGFRIRDLMIAITLTDAFRYRVVPSEGACE